MSLKQKLKLVLLCTLHFIWDLFVCVCPLRTTPRVGMMEVDHVTSALICSCTHTAHTISCTAYCFERDADMCNTVKHAFHACINVASIPQNFLILHVDQERCRHIFYWFIRGFACLREKDTGMCFLRWCHLAWTSPEQLGVFRNVTMTTGSSLTGGSFTG